MILLNDFRRQWEDTRERALRAFTSVGESGSYILGSRVEAFESSLARCWGLRYSVGVGSGLDALEIALTIAGCQRGDRVLTTPLSAFATTMAIIKAGAIPVFIDTDAFGLISLSACREVLKNRSDIRFLVPVHLYGNVVDLNELRRLQDEFDLAVVEDCAQSILATFDGLPTGSVSEIAATSFYPTKNLGAMGDGGAILTNSEASFEAAKVLRNYGQTEKYLHERLGFNSRLDELQAALLDSAYLPVLPRWTARRREVARCYLDGIQNAGIRCLGSPRGSASSWHLFPVLVSPNHRRQFIAYLNENGIAAGEHYPTLIPCQNALKGWDMEVVNQLDTAERICESEVSLPIHPYLTQDEVRQVIEVCNEWKI